MLVHAAHFAHGHICAGVARCKPDFAALDVRTGQGPYGEDCVNCDECIALIQTTDHSKLIKNIAKRRLVWFSCGAASAVAAKLTVETYGDACEVVYCDTMATEHEDNVRFFNDIERWIGRPITVVRSTKYKTVDDVFERTRYMAGPKGARCTAEMKKVPREVFQRFSDVHIFGYTSDEQKRANDFEDRNPSLHVEWILIDHKVSKDDCLRMLREQKIDLPVMYNLGFDHNNCKGCVKSASPGYWNRTRRLFPDVFERRACQSRATGVRLVKLHGRRIFLDELPLDASAPDDDIDCGPVCQIPRPICRDCGEDGDVGVAFCALCGGDVV